LAHVIVIGEEETAMINTVMVELDKPALRVQEDVEAIARALPFKVYAEGGYVLVDVEDSDDPVEEVRSRLEKAGIKCIVYDPAVQAAGKKG
jgi:hypothetical protein